MTPTRAGAWRSLAVGVVLVATAAMAFAAAGSLDPSFGTGGIWTINGCGASPLAAQTDGRIVVSTSMPVGTNEIGGTRSEWQIRRLTASGALDSAFGTAGLVRLFGESGQDLPAAMVIDASGRAVAVGTTYVKTTTVTGTGKKQTITYTFTPYATLVRLAAGGSLDASFGSGGVVRTSVPGATWGASGQYAVLQADGRIAIAGWARVADASIGTGFRTYTFVARYLDNGSLDTSFGTGGITVDPRPPLHATGGGGPYGLALQSTGHLVVASLAAATPSSSTAICYVSRYTSAGALDTGFATVATSNAIRGLSVDRFDRIVTTGYTPPQNLIALVHRYLSGGTADTTFGAGGVATINLLQLRAPVFEPDGKIVFGGQVSVGTPSRWLATTLRLTDEGALDTTYGTGGFGAVIDLGGSIQTGTGAVAVTPDGEIVMGGFGAPYGYVAKYSAN